jgi:hypothetical protein
LACRLALMDVMAPDEPYTRANPPPAAGICTSQTGVPFWGNATVAEEYALLNGGGSVGFTLNAGPHGAERPRTCHSDCAASGHGHGPGRGGRLGNHFFKRSSPLVSTHVCQFPRAGVGPRCMSTEAGRVSGHWCSTDSMTGVMVAIEIELNFNAECERKPVADGSNGTIISFWNQGI